MFRPVELFIGLRYTRARRRNHFISFISLISMAGIALGVAALITVLSVMNGFEKELRQRILGIVAHTTVLGGPGGIADWPAVVKQLSAVKHVIGVAPYVEEEGMLNHQGAVSGVMVRGVLPEAERSVSNIGEKMVLGRLEDLKPGEYGIVLGKDLAYALGVGVGDRVTLITPQAMVTPVGFLPRLKRRCEKQVVEFQTNPACPGRHRGCGTVVRDEGPGKRDSSETRRPVSRTGP